MAWGIVVLAAGMSSRMGRQKLLLDWGGTTVLGRVLETLDLAMGERQASAVAVIGGDGEAVAAEAARLAAARRLDLICASNPDYRNGEMIDSIRVGLRALPETSDRALIVLGDQPQLSVEAARSVIQAAELSAAPILVPVCGGRRGHPWAVEKSLWDEMRRARTARDFLDARRTGIEECAADATILADLDTPEDYERERRREAALRGDR